MNMIDLVAIIPFYLNILLEGLEDFEIIGEYTFNKKKSFTNFFVTKRKVFRGNIKGILRPKQAL